jgi:single-strand DNA-binding protein
MSLNKVMLIGNVGKDPEIRYLDGAGQNNPNSKVANFTLATSEKYRDRNGNLQERTEWHNIVAWRNSADIAEKYVKKGTQLYIEGKLRTRDWTDQSGNKHYTTEVVVDNLQLLGRRSDNPANQDGGQQYGAPAQQYSRPAQQPAYSQPQQAPAHQFSQPQQPAYSQPAQQFNQQQPAGQTPEDEPSDDLPF